jgi:hypothetical protein
MIAFNPLPQNADASIRTNRETDSNVTERSDGQEEKQPCPIASTDDGIMMAFNSLPQNAEASTCTNRETDSKVTERSDRQEEKQPAQSLQLMME